MRALLIKMSSLGDVVHTLPAVTDAAAHGVTFDWLVEEAFADIPARHPAVVRVVPIAWRRWRKHLLRNRRAVGSFVKDLRECEYDLVLDAQGLWKSALAGACARGTVWGFDRASAREGACAWLYAERIAVPPDAHAVDRLRQLFAGVFGYAVTGAADFGLPPLAATGEKRSLLCHGTTWPSKHWPEPMWTELASKLLQLGYRVLLPWGNDVERGRAQRIADGSGAEVLPALTMSGLLQELGGAALVVGVDSGLSHLAGALGVPTLAIYGSTGPDLTGARGARVVNLAAEFTCAPCRSRSCRYQGPLPEHKARPVAPPCYASITPERVLAAVETL